MVPWTLSRLSTESLDFVHELPGLHPWTLSSLPELYGYYPEFPWTLSRLSTESMVRVQGVQGIPGLSSEGSYYYKKEKLQIKMIWNVTEYNLLIFLILQVSSPEVVVKTVMAVNSVERLFPTLQHSRDITGHILERNHSPVRSVGNVFLRKNTWNHTWWSTLGLETIENIGKIQTPEKIAVTFCNYRKFCSYISRRCRMNGKQCVDPDKTAP